MPHDVKSGVYYTVQGDGPPVIVGLPAFASQAEILGLESVPVIDGLLSGLRGFRLLFMDYPSIGKSADIDPDALTADRVCADILSVADDAGFERFAYIAYSWGAAVGLQLSARTDRLAALAIGGWPPLNAPYDAILAASTARIGRVEPGAMKVLRTADQYRQWSTFYRSLTGWDEVACTAAIKCPKLLYFGANGDLIEAGFPVPIATRCREARSILEEQGWTVHELEGFGHEAGLRTDLITAFVGPFLREIAPWA
jgi:pimeloyl-ACP methyl ester carboxylesterase